MDVSYKTYKLYIYHHLSVHLEEDNKDELRNKMNCLMLEILHKLLRLEESIVNVYI